MVAHQECEVIEAYKKISWVWLGIVRMPGLEELPAEVAPYLKPQNGVCAAASENVMNGLTSYQSFLEPRLPLETDYSAPVQRAREFEQHLLEICGLQIYDGFLMPAAYGFPLPYLRRDLAFTLLSISRSDYLRFYTPRESKDAARAE